MTWVRRGLGSARFRAASFWTKPPSTLEKAIVRRVASRYRMRNPDLDVPPYVAIEDRDLPAGLLNRSGMISLAWWFLATNRLEGDYLEFGSFRGRTFRLAWEHHKRHFDGKVHFWLFDSFEGMPEPVGIDAHPKFRTGSHRSTVEELHTVAANVGIPRDAYTIVEGRYEERLTAELQAEFVENGVRAALVYVDCDYHSSTKAALEFVYPLLQPGTVICFDDFYLFDGAPDRGEQLALRELLDAHPEFDVVEYDRFSVHGKTFIAHFEGRHRGGGDEG